MGPTCRLLRFFRLLPPAHPVSRLGLGLTAAIGSSLLALGVTSPDALLVPLLVLQALAASAGFTVPARRGHYDLLFTLGYGRVQVAVAQWALSAAAGAATWMWLASVEALSSRSWPSLVEPGPIALMMFASTVPWALTIHLPRLSGGIGMAVGVAFTWAVIPAIARAAATDHLSSSGWLELAAATAVSTMALAWGLRTAARMDVPLEAAQ